MNPYEVDPSTYECKVYVATTISNTVRRFGAGIFKYDKNIIAIWGNSLHRLNFNMNTWDTIYILSQTGHEWLQFRSADGKPRVTLPDCILQICRVWLNSNISIDLHDFLYKTLGDPI